MKNKFLIPDFLILAVIIIGMSIFSAYADWALLVSYIFVVLYKVLTRRWKGLMHLGISTVIALIWVFFAQKNYAYNYEYLSVFGMNILPILAWSLGLLGVSELFNYFRVQNDVMNFILFVPVFWLLLILIETYAFHVIEIRDTGSGNAIGLPFCNCIHAPWWMRIVYFTMGPAYYAFTIISDRITADYIRNDNH